MGTREFYRTDCEGFTVLAIRDETDSTGKKSRKVRAQCLQNVPDNARAWDDGVWITDTCVDFAAYCTVIADDAKLCRLGQSNTFMYPFELAGACVDVTENGCVYLLSSKEVQVTVRSGSETINGGVCSPRCPHFLWRFGKWRTTDERWRVCADKCSKDEVEIVSASTSREEARQCTLCLSTNAISKFPQFLHPGEGLNGANVCNETPCYETSGSLKYAQLINFDKKSVIDQPEEQRRCAASCEDANVQQLQSYKNNFVCTKLCDPYKFYQKTDTGARCLETCNYKVS